MDKRVILAVAGSGKTYHLCHTLKEEERNVIIAYTHENTKNILNELVQRFGYIPERTMVMTFHSFIYQYMIRPFDILIGDFYGQENFISKGVTISSPPEKSIQLKNGMRIQNPNYDKIGTLKHYINNDKYYSDYLSKLILKTKNRKNSLIDISCNHVNRFFDKIYVDEMQDFREYNWKMLVEMIKRVDSILLVGDYYQHSVSAINNHGIPFQNKNNYINYIDYVSYLRQIGLEVDTETLLKSRRCSIQVCQFIKRKLNIDIDSIGNNKGNIVWLNTKEEVKQILKDDKIIKLVWEKTEQYNFKAISWSYSKGNTYNGVCLILTKKYSDLDCEDFKLPSSKISINKLYVALTRSNSNVYIIKHSIFDEVYHEERAN